MRGYDISCTTFIACFLTFFLDLFIEVVDVKGLVWRILHGGWEVDLRGNRYTGFIEVLLLHAAL